MDVEQNVIDPPQVNEHVDPQQMNDNIAAPDFDENNDPPRDNQRMNDDQIEGDHPQVDENVDRQQLDENIDPQQVAGNVDHQQQDLQNDDDENLWEPPNFQWRRANLEPPNIHAFSANAGVEVDTTDFEPKDFYSLFVNDDLINHFVVQTNLFANQYIQSHPNLPRYSNVRSWTETNVAEMKQFWGLTLLMVIIKKPRIAQYWS